MRRVFIAWVRYDRRSELMAEHLDATMYFIHHGRRGNLPQTSLRYAAQSYQTWQVLRRERPDIVFVQNPPIFCAMIAFAYACGCGARFAIDSHSGAFVSRKWRWSLPLHRALSRSALVTIVPNEDISGIVTNWGCRSYVLGFTRGEYPVGEPFALDGSHNVVVISTFAEDEPLAVVFEAARCLPEVTFYVTGDSTRVPPGALVGKPDNCHLTGYLPYERYIGLLRGVDAIIDLTTRDHTLLMGAYEAVSLGVPLIVSDWPILKESFPRGTVHVANTMDGVCAGVRRVLRQQEELRSDISALRDDLNAEWDYRLAELRQLLAGQEHLARNAVGSSS